jgi:hypothetical protein
MVKITYKGETREIPKRYLPDTLSKADRQKQIKSIFEKANRPKVKVPKRKSKWTIAFDSKYGDAIDKLKGGRSKRNIAKVSGIPFKAIDEVYKKAEGAYYSSGSRPNQSATSWALGRTYAYIMGGEAVRRLDKHITDKYNVKFSIKTIKTKRGY